MKPSDLPGKTLEDFFRQDFRHLPAVKKHALVRSFGRFVHTLFDMGMPCRRLSLDQFRVGGEELSISFDGVDNMSFLLHRRPLSDRRRLGCLRHLCSRLLTGTTRNQRFRFLQAVQGGQGRLRDLRALATRLEMAALPLARRYWRRLARRCLSDNDAFETARRGAWRTWSRRRGEASRLLEALLPDPDALLRQGRTMGGRGSGCTAGRIEVDGRPYFIKRYRQTGARYKFKYLFLRSRALSAWYAGWQFHARDLPAAPPLLLMERRQCGFLQDAYLVYEFCDDGRPLMDAWPQLTRDEKRDIIIRAARLLARVHMCRCIHGDSNWNNLLLREGGDLLLVDLDCAKVMSSFDYARAYRDLEHFIRDLRRRRNNGVEFLDLFITVWRRWLGLADRVSREEHDRIVLANPGRKIDDCI